MTAGSPEIPYLSYDAIGEKAMAFLEEIGRSDTLPVDIEAIVELDLRLTIFSIPGLQDAMGMDAFLSGNLKEITVDQFVLQKRPNRYRFSLAHELGHLKLHASIYADSKFSTSQEWKDWHAELVEDDRSWLERHANAFAGYLLVPTAHLRAKFFDLLPEAKEKTRKCADKGLPADEALDHALSWMADRISPDFQVSPRALKIQLEREKLGNSI